MIEKGNLISEGKAKSLYETQNQNELLMVYRVDTSVDQRYIIDSPNIDS